MIFPRTFPSNFKEASDWRQAIFDFSNIFFPDQKKRVTIKPDRDEFKVIVHCSSEQLKKYLNDLMLPVKIEFRPWYGDSDHV